MPYLWKMVRRLSYCLILLTCLLLGQSGSVGTAERLLPFSPGPRRVNAPYGVRGHEAAIFWFGRVTPTENYADARVGYRDDYLFVHLGIMDRLLWYDRSPSPGDLTAWDAVTLYLSTEGNVGDVPGSNAYRFDAQLVWWGDRTDYQVAYQGDGSGWVTATLPFTTTSSWNGNAPNDDVDDRGWSLIYSVPFESLGLSSPPAQDTVWGMALALHDRDDAGGPPRADQVWPETMVPEQPATWGQLAFGLLPSYVPQPAVPGGTLTIRNGMSGATVVDADVGGSSNCGWAAAPDYFPTWGELNYAGKEFLNIQNLGYISEWPCFSKYYVTFPLDALPPGKVVLSATLTLYQFGNAGQGYDPGPQPSLIQVLTVDRDWEESTLTWNNAPLAVENVSASWVDPLGEPPDWPGILREWDVSRAVAEAHAKGEPLRLAMYSPAWDLHSGRYFWTSDVGASGEGRPTLTITWGQPAAEIEKIAVPSYGDQGSSITYTLSFLGSGNPLVLTDTLPAGVAWGDNLVWSGTSTAPAYDGDHHHLTWGGTLSTGQKALITYTVAISTANHRALVNTAQLAETGGYSSVVTVTVIANPWLAHMPLILKRH